MNREPYLVCLLQRLFMVKICSETSAPSFMRALAESEAVFLVMARTFQSDFNNDLTTLPPCAPVAPWTAIILDILLIPLVVIWKRFPEPKLKSDCWRCTEEVLRKNYRREDIVLTLQKMASYMPYFAQTSQAVRDESSATYKAFASHSRKIYNNPQ